jgi:hypothetical protein
MAEAEDWDLLLDDDDDLILQAFFFYNFFFPMGYLVVLPSFHKGIRSSHKHFLCGALLCVRWEFLLFMTRFRGFLLVGIITKRTWLERFLSIRSWLMTGCLH